MAAAGDACSSDGLFNRFLPSMAHVSLTLHLTVPVSVIIEVNITHYNYWCPLSTNGPS